MKAGKPPRLKPTVPGNELKTKAGIIIQHPERVLPIFDGLVAIHSTCRDCGELMQVIRPDEKVHPCCDPKPTYIESLATGWLSCAMADDEESAALTLAEFERRMEEHDSKPPPLRAAALQYISWGWPVFPLQAHSKEPATRHGFKDATTDRKTVKRWWTKHPDHNIGLPTGIKFDVFDVDPANGGVPSFLKMLEAKRIPPSHGLVTTSSGGIHLYMLPTGKGNRANFLTGLDYRGKGGYVVSPPSTLGERGRAWTWTCVPSPRIKVIERKP